MADISVGSVISREGSPATPASARSAVSREGNPGPLGLAGFAMTTLLLSLTNAKLIGGSSVQVVLAVALVYGGVAQLLAGMWEFRKGNTFAATAFSSYGAFWISFVLIEFVFAANLKPADASGAIGTYLASWGVFTFYMWIASFKHGWPLIIVFLFVWLTFGLLALGEFTSNGTISQIGGYTGIVAALGAWYASARGVINDSFGREILPG